MPKGTQLEPLILIPEFWFAWSQFRPDTRLFAPARYPTLPRGRTS